VVRGVDTTFLVELEVAEAEHHREARAFFDKEVLDVGAQVAIAPQVLAEFIHIVTDPRRFTRPVSAAEAVARAHLWWQAKEVKQVLPSIEATELFLDWMKVHRLGRKRILDTQLAATYHAAGVDHIISSHARDFTIFGCVTVVQPWD
jgi:predicted nucleic acid-binding protein